MRDLTEAYRRSLCRRINIFKAQLTETDLKEANRRLTEWLIFYNLERPHQALNYKAPIEWYNENYNLMKMLPMYPTYTGT
ncbi:MAG: hypothetical protein KatS3mg091_644 [Patescibacteria group bacterium]|nr:MAG: hypothetical protein KatS3mg091_644 [Patescibacteria group bacterium]